jgi:hypothetical protein
MFILSEMNKAVAISDGAPHTRHSSARSVHTHCIIQGQGLLPKAQFASSSSIAALTTRVTGGGSAGLP